MTPRAWLAYWRRPAVAITLICGLPVALVGVLLWATGGCS